MYAKKYEDEVAKDRRKREARAGLTEEERYSEVGTLRDWTDYVGEQTKAAVSVEIAPRQGETFWSGLGRALSASQGYVPGRAKYVFKGDLQDAQWYRNGEPVDPVIGGRTPQRVYVQNASDIQSVAVVHGETFRDIRPASTIVKVDFIDRKILVEIEAEAVYGGADDKA